MPSNDFPFDGLLDVSSRTAAGSIPYFVDMRTIKGRASYDGQSFTCTVWSEWPQPFGFIKAMLGTQSVGSGSPANLTRTVPEKFPYPSDDVAETPKFWCTQCDLQSAFMNGLSAPDYNPAWLKPQPNQDINQWPEAKWAAYECAFSTIPADILTDDEMSSNGYVDGDDYLQEWFRYCIYDDEPHEELERIPQGQVVVDNGDGTATYLHENVSRRVGYVRRSLTWMNVPQLPPEQNFIDCSQRVNDAAFMGFAAEKVLFATHRRKPKTNLIGDLIWDLTYCLYIRTDERTWNQVYDRNNVLRNLKVLTGGNPAAPVFGADKPFRTANLGKLFRFE